MKVTYNAKARIFQLNWKDYEKAANGERPYIHTERAWTGKKQPTKKEKDEKIKEYLAFCQEQEERSKKIADAKLKDIENNQDCIVNAWEYFLHLPEEELCKSIDAVTRPKARQICNEFGTFMKNNFPNIFLHEVREKHIHDYFRSIKKLSYGALNGRRKRLQFVFKNVVIRNKDSELPFRNPLEDYNLGKVRGNNIVRKMPFDENQLKALYSETETAKGYTKGNYQKQLKALVYFHCVTGWRSQDITGLKWEQVNFENRTITVEHRKTKKDGTTTVIYMTDIMLDILKTIKESFKNDKLNLVPEFVFPLRKHLRKNTVMDLEKVSLSGYTIVKKYINHFRKNHGLTATKKSGVENQNPYTLHSLRNSVIQQLSLPDYNSDKINYLVGHAMSSINGTNYLRLEAEAKEATKSMIEHLEKIIGARFWNDEARIRSEEEKQKENLEAIRKNNPVSSGGFVVDIDPRTGKRTLTGI